MLDPGQGALDLGSSKRETQGGGQQIRRRSSKMYGCILKGEGSKIPCTAPKAIVNVVNGQ